MRFYTVLLFMAVALFLNGCANNPKPKKTKKSAFTIPEIQYTVVNKLPHSINSFTEGLLFNKNKLFESTGSPIEYPNTQSVIGITDSVTGELDVKVKLDKNKYFGEGIVFVNDKLFQITYLSQACFVYDATSFKKINEYKYQNEQGWGLTTDGKYIIMSDGTNVLQFRNPSNFEVVSTLQVTSNNYAVDFLNELEYINGFIYANVWLTNIIVKIDPATGIVVGKIDLTNLHNQALGVYPNSLETNGIAYDSVLNKVVVTGKMWPYIFQIDFDY